MFTPTSTITVSGWMLQSVNRSTQKQRAQALTAKGNEHAHAFYGEQSTESASFTLGGSYTGNITLPALGDGITDFTLTYSETEFPKLDVTKNSAAGGGSWTAPSRSPRVLSVAPPPSKVSLRQSARASLSLSPSPVSISKKWTAQANTTPTPIRVCVMSQSPSPSQAWRVSPLSPPPTDGLPPPPPIVTPIQPLRRGLSSSRSTSLSGRTRTRRTLILNPLGAASAGSSCLSYFIPCCRTSRPFS